MPPSVVTLRISARVHDNYKSHGGWSRPRNADHGIVGEVRLLKPVCLRFERRAEGYDGGLWSSDVKQPWMGEAGCGYGVCFSGYLGKGEICERYIFAMVERAGFLVTYWSSLVLSSMRSIIVFCQINILMMITAIGTASIHIHRI